MGLTRYENIQLASLVMQFIGKHGCTQKEFADICGLSRDTINKFLNGHLRSKSLSRTSVAKIMMTLNNDTRYPNINIDI